VGGWKRGGGWRARGGEVLRLGKGRGRRRQLGASGGRLRWSNSKCRRTSSLRSRCLGAESPMFKLPGLQTLARPACARLSPFPNPCPPSPSRSPPRHSVLPCRLHVEALSTISLARPPPPPIRNSALALRWRRSSASWPACAGTRSRSRSRPDSRRDSAPTRARRATHAPNPMQGLGCVQRPNAA
jgi:hypothetical protein